MSGIYIPGMEMPKSCLTPDMIGANNYSDYDPEYCDGHFCPRDCEICGYREGNREEEDDG